MARFGNAHRAGSTTRAINPTPIAAACALLLWGAAAQAQAQTQPTDAAPAQVVVTGIRGSIESSIAIKKESDSIVESITAEDIGKLPDQSIAESIARLPGLSAQRVAGRAQVISLRGLAPDFGVTLLNGREQTSTSNDRSAEFDQYPSELLSGVVVYKTPDANMTAAGLSGTIDLRTVRPLDRKGRTVAFNVRGEHNSNGELNSGWSNKGKRMSVSYIDQYLNNTFGLAIGYAHLDTPGQQKEYKSWWWGNNNKLPAGNEDVIALKGAEVTSTSRKQVRDGLMAVLDWKPSRDLRSTLDLYYSQFDQEEIMRGMMWNSADTVTYRNPRIETIGGTRLLTGGTLVGMEPIARNDYNERRDEMGALGWNTRLRLNDRWAVDGDLSYSTAKRRETTSETYAGLGPAGSGATDDNFQFQIPVGAGLPQFTPSKDFTNPGIIRLTDVGGWGHDATMHHPRVEDRLGAAKLNVRGELDGWFSNVQAGLSYSKRDKSHEDVSQTYWLKNNRALTTVPADIIGPTTSLAWAGIPGVLSFDPRAALDRFYDKRPVDTDVAQQDWAVSEKQALGYLRLGIDTDLGDVGLRGNLGVQYVHVNQEGQGKAVSGNLVTPLRDEHSYHDVLPSLNLNFDFGNYLHDTYLRFGAAKTVARPRMSDMRAGVGAGVDATTRMWNGGGGNPKLEPWRANSFDLSLEHYMGKGSYVSAAWFFKDLKSYIYNQQRPFDFSAFPNSSAVIPISNIGTINQPANGQGGFVRGVELAGSLQFGSLWQPLDGFGVQASLSGTESSISPNGPGATEKLPGLSGVVRNITLFYEKSGFSARVAQRYRSAFRGEVTGLFAQRAFSEILAEDQVDIQLGYEFQSGPWKNLGFLLQVNNLGNEPYQTRQGSPFASGAYAPERYTTYGRQVLFGVNYKL
ncbi:TonB-dependent receptor [Massilia sp. G4R7]|uniref:TonB-dependent receptor n=1 Tax=Massilia phyllostachyos TaxID=2898585 RepID=A0ABS8Q9E5_9BURK|nr:TonB-dependent receptor [Massilia phyllostachyos]MCD2518381.1 TonB-dependent receptor [Massilia phyllostachyos]